jgi:preprotein translocase subunit SecD
MLGDGGLARLFALLLFSILAAGLPPVSPAACAGEALLLEVADAQASFDERTNEPVVRYRLIQSSARRFAAFTTRNVGRKVEFRVDGRVVMSPVIREPILGGMGQISAGFNINQAKDIAGRLSSGAARVEVEIVQD